MLTLLKNKQRKEILNKKDLKKLSHLLLRNENEYNPDYLKAFQLSETELLKGVICPECSSIPLTRTRGRWLCNNCSLKSKNAHLEALVDYSFLIGNEITNKQARSFLKIESESTTHKILSSLNLIQSGSFKGRKYELSKLVKHLK